VQLVGEDTQLRLSGTVALKDERIAVRAAGGANLGILQGFLRNVRGSGRAEMTAAINGPLRQPQLSGSATITDGRIRHFALPNSLEAVNGTNPVRLGGIRWTACRRRSAAGACSSAAGSPWTATRLAILDVTVRGGRHAAALAGGHSVHRRCRPRGCAVAPAFELASTALHVRAADGSPRGRTSR